MVINSTGETAHSSVPQYGRNALLQIIDFIPKLLALEEDFPVDDFQLVCATEPSKRSKC